MKRKSNLAKGETGQVLVYVTIIVALTALVLTPLLRFTYTGHQSVRVREERMLELYAADAGIEDAMYQIKNEDDIVGIQNLSYGQTYNPGTPDGWNDRAMDVTVEKVWIPADLGVAEPAPGTDYSDKLVTVGLFTNVELGAAQDDFESGNWVGGTGWAADWVPTGSASIGSGTDAHLGNYYLKFEGSNGNAKRKGNLTSFYVPRLRFYANADSFEPADSAELSVSTDGSSWAPLMTWAQGNDTGFYEYYDIPLTSYGNSSEFWVAFDSTLTGSSGSVAWDDFESGGWSGGSGWNGSWSHSGGNHAEITSAGGPHGGNYHLRIRRSDGDANREILGLASYDAPRLQFYAKRTNNWESSDRTRLRVRSNEMNWTTIKTWYRGDIGSSYQAEDIDLSPYVSPTTTWFQVRFDAGMSRSNEHFYVDDIDIVGSSGGHFYVDDLWIGNRVDTYTIELAYTDANVGSVYLDKLGVWMPPGWQYESVVADAWDVPDSTPFEPTITPSFAGGTVLIWDFPLNAVDLSKPAGGMPIVKSLSFRYTGGEADEGVFTWMETQEGYLSWDTGYEIYRATSKASHAIWGSNTRVESYIAQGEIEKRGVASYGNYVATGNPLLIDYTGSTTVKETPIDPDNPATWVWKDSILYNGRSSITTAPDDAEVLAAWLYWSAYHSSSVPDEDVEFMYPEEYGPESFSAYDGNGDDTYTTTAYNLPRSEPTVSLPRDVAATIYPKRYYGEWLGHTEYGVPYLFLIQVPSQKQLVADPPAKVYLDGGLLTEGVDYTISYATQFVTIINYALVGDLTIDYSVDDGETLVKGVDFTVDYENGTVTIINDVLVGTVTIEYWAEHWEAITHEAYDRYGTPLDPVSMSVLGNGYAYAGFRDVTDLVKGTGNGEFAVRNVDAAEGTGFPEACYSGWSLIVLYKSPSETAHQFYLYDPIHNPDTTPFFSGQYTDIPFTLTEFYPPAGTVDGRITYFVGEGDEHYSGDYIRFKGVSQPTYTALSDPPTNPENNVLNEKSTTGERGVDVDTFDITAEVGDDTEANVQFTTDTDGWFLVYVVLSFKTAMVPKADYAFNVAAVTYSYELGAGP